MFLNLGGDYNKVNFLTHNQRVGRLSMQWVPAVHNDHCVPLQNRMYDFVPLCTIVSYADCCVLLRTNMYYCVQLVYYSVHLRSTM